MKRNLPKYRKTLYLYLFLAVTIPLSVYAVVRFQELSPSARDTGLIRGNVKVIAEVDSKNNVTLSAVKQSEDLAVSSTQKVEGPVLTTVDRTGKSKVILPVNKSDTYKFRHEFDNNKNLVESKSGQEKAILYEYLVEEAPNLQLKLSSQFNSASLSQGAVSLDSVLVDPNQVSIQAATVKTLFTNSENRSKDKAFDIFIVGVCYESDVATYNRLSDVVFNKIINGDFFKDNLYRVNIHKLEGQASGIGCSHSSSGAVKITNIVKPLGADTVVVLVNNTARVSYGYFPTSSYLGTAWMTRPITDLDQLVLHEMGHSIGQLSDEYVNISNPNAFSASDVTTQAIQPQFKNCQSTCSAFNPKYVSLCSKGCGYTTALYRTTPTSIMKNWSGVFNLISKDAIDYAITIFAPKSATPGPPGSDDTTSPSVSITSPSNGSTVSGNNNINVKASDNISVASLNILIDNSVVRVCGAVTSCVYSWNTSGFSNGTHTIKAEARDVENNIGSTTISLNVNNAALPTPPSSSDTSVITSPANNSTVLFPLNINWSKVTNASTYSFWFGTSVGKNDLYGKNFNGNVIFSHTYSLSTFWRKPVNGQTMYVRLWTRLSSGVWKYSDYTYMYSTATQPPTPPPPVSTEKSTVEMSGTYYTNVANTYPRLKFYINKVESGSVLEFRENKNYVIQLDRKVNKGDVVSIAFYNDTENNGQFNADRNVILIKVKLDGKTVYASSPVGNDSTDMTMFNVVYDRTNKEDGSKYYSTEPSWGNIPQGFWDNIGLSPHSLRYLYWNGAINITSK